MNANKFTVGDYGWKDEKPIGGFHPYMDPCIVSLLMKYGARKVLDLGCGNGALCRTLSKYGFEVIGCDADPKGVEIARSSSKDITFKNIGVYDDPSILMDENFDAVVSTEVIEHLFLPRYLPRFAKKILKENGYLIISTPYYSYLINLIIAILNRWDAHHQPLGDGAHIKFWSRSTLTKLLNEEGFEVIEFIGLGRFRYLWTNMVLVSRIKAD
jgi:2-polyprenyl-3-methyl-5-hydroxy-6-metoxy-1,4-benzoquinol methylase